MNVVKFVMMVRDVRADVPNRLFHKEMILEHVPVEGDLILLIGAENGWNETVRSRWFDVTNAEWAIEFKDVTDAHEEGLADKLLEAGWVEPK